MSVFESGYKEDLERETAMKLVRDAICAGIFNDLGSGSNVDLCILTKDKTEYLRNYEVANKKGVRYSGLQIDWDKVYCSIGIQLTLIQGFSADFGCL